MRRVTFEDSWMTKEGGYCVRSGCSRQRSAKRSEEGIECERTFCKNVLEAGVRERGIIFSLQREIFSDAC